jgi:hypothetical protein
MVSSVMQRARWTAHSCSSEIALTSLVTACQMGFVNNRGKSAGAWGARSSTPSAYSIRRDLSVRLARSCNSFRQLMAQLRLDLLPLIKGSLVCEDLTNEVL